MANMVPLIQLQYGKETVWGTEVAATARWMGVDPNSLKVTPSNMKKLSRYARANFAPSHKSTVTSRGGTLQFGGDFNYDDFLIALLCSMKAGVTGTGAGDNKTWNFDAPLATAPTVESRTMEVTDGGDPFTLMGVFCTGWRLSGSSSQDGLVGFSSSWAFKDWSTSALTAAIADRDVKYLPGLMMNLWVDALGGTIGTTAKTGALIDWSVSYEMARPVRRAAGSLLPYKIGYGVPKISISLTLENNAAGKGEKDAGLANTGRLIRLGGTGDTLGTGTYALNVDCAAHYAQDPDLWDNDDDDTTVKLTAVPIQDTGAFAGYFKVGIVNAIAAVTG